MDEYALLVAKVFRRIRLFATRPNDIPHKQVTWHPVVRTFGVPFEGLEADDWVIRKVDPATLPPPVPSSITRRQCALQLLSMQYVTPEEALAMTKSAELPTAVSAIFAQAVAGGTMTADQRTLAEIDFAAINYYRSNSLLGLMGLTDVEIDQFFIAAVQL